MRLTYEKYKNSENVLLIDLHNNYVIVAIKLFNKEENKYIVELRIKHFMDDKWDLIDEELEFENCNVNSAILKNVSEMYENGVFDKYIERYRYEADCFDEGFKVKEGLH